MTPSSSKENKAYQVLALGMAGAMVWLPWDRGTSAVNLVGFLLIFRALGALAREDEAFRKVQLWLSGAAACALIDLVWGGWTFFYRQGQAIVFPRTVNLDAFLLGAVVWIVADRLIENAAAHKNILLRDTAAQRRDLYMLYLVALGVATGPLTFLLYTRLIGPGLYQWVWWLVVAYRYVVLALWYQLCSQAARGFEGERGVL